MGVFVHPQLGLRFGAALPGAFFSQKYNTFLKKTLFFIILKQYVFIKLDLICNHIEETLSKPAS